MVRFSDQISCENVAIKEEIARLYNIPAQFQKLEKAKDFDGFLLVVERRVCQNIHGYFCSSHNCHAPKKIENESDLYWIRGDNCKEHCARTSFKNHKFGPYFDENCEKCILSRLTINDCYINEMSFDLLRKLCVRLVGSSPKNVSKEGMMCFVSQVAYDYYNSSSNKDKKFNFMVDTETHARKKRISVPWSVGIDCSNERLTKIGNKVNIFIKARAQLRKKEITTKQFYEQLQSRLEKNNIDNNNDKSKSNSKTKSKRKTKMKISNNSNTCNNECMKNKESTVKQTPITNKMKRNKSIAKQNESLRKRGSKSKTSKNCRKKRRTRNSGSKSKSKKKSNRSQSEVANKTKKAKEKNKAAIDSNRIELNDTISNIVSENESSKKKAKSSNTLLSNNINDNKKNINIASKLIEMDRLPTKQNNNNEFGIIRNNQVSETSDTDPEDIDIGIDLKMHTQLKTQATITMGLEREVKQFVKQLNVKKCHIALESIKTRLS